MAMAKRKIPTEINLNLVPMIDITSFILLSLAILVMSIKKEASLDNIIKLPPVLHASKQEKTQLQIYILPAVIMAGGVVNPDSTGLVAFVGKSAVPEKCPNCGLLLRDAKNKYVPNTLRKITGQSLASLSTDVTSTKVDDPNLKKERPPAYWCVRCNQEISPYLRLDDIPKALKAKKKEVLDQLVKTENYSRQNKGIPQLTPAEIKNIEDDIPLMIKADDKAFYGRILQVVDMARDTSCDLKKFAFVTLAEASLEAQKKNIMGK